MPICSARKIKLCLEVITLTSLCVVSQLSISKILVLFKPSSVGTEDSNIRWASTERERKFVTTGLSDEEYATLRIRLEKASQVTKYILRYGKKGIKEHRIPVNMCGKCEITYDPQMIQHPETKAVLIQFNQFNWTTLRNLKRRSDQLFIWHTMESTDALRRRNMDLEYETKFMFNLTRSYRRDSEIYQPYERIDKILETKMEQGIHKNISNIIRNKTRLAVAAMSNCAFTSGAGERLEIVKKLIAAGLQVDTLGRCFGNRLEQSRAEFLRGISKYKFSFGFENAFHCRDYITEKFLGNGHKAGTVPVVIGAAKADYVAIAPKGSFIFAEDFSSISDLVKYLSYLDKNDEEYLKYFRWIEEGRSSMPKQKVAGFCRLCRMLHGINVDDIHDPGYNRSSPVRPLFTDDVAARTVKDLRKWFYGTENEDCFNRKSVLT